MACCGGDGEGQIPREVISTWLEGPWLQACIFSTLPMGCKRHRDTFSNGPLLVQAGVGLGRGGNQSACLSISVTFIQSPAKFRDLVKFIQLILNLYIISLNFRKYVFYNGFIVKDWTSFWSIIKTSFTLSSSVYLVLYIYWSELRPDFQGSISSVVVLDQKNNSLNFKQACISLAKETTLN